MSDDYEVGYGKPPKHSRWTKGNSGNPGGREAGHKGFRTDLEDSLNKVSTVENRLTGKKMKGRNQKLAIQLLVERAALGDLKAQALLFPMIMQVLGAEDRHKGARKLSSLDQQILAEVLASRLTDASEGEAEAETGPEPESGTRSEPGPTEEGDDAP